MEERQDLISRQAAIDALSHMCSEDENGITVSRDNVSSMLRALPSAQPERKQMTNKEWIDFLSVQFDISRTSAREMLHGMMQCKREDNFKKQFNRRWEQE